MDTKTYAEEFLQFMQTVHRNKHALNVSTITLICDLNVDNVDIKTFCQHFNEPNITMKICPHGFDTTRKGRVRKSFYNQVTLNYKDISKKSMKIFSNGKLQITGLTSLYECEKQDHDLYVRCASAHVERPRNHDSTIVHRYDKL
jgi:hypothetical protein